MLPALLVAAALLLHASGQSNEHPMKATYLQGHTLR
jgi:hypothetical protein